MKLSFLLATEENCQFLGSSALKSFVRIQNNLNGIFFFLSTSTKTQLYPTILKAKGHVLSVTAVMKGNPVVGLLQCDAPYRGHPTNFIFLQVSQSGYSNLINGHASLQSPTGKWRNNELLKIYRFVFYGYLVKKGLLGGHGKARCTETIGTEII